MARMSIDDKLGLDTFHTDEENSHIDVDLESTDEAEIKKLLLACPAECYKYIDGKFSFSWLGCLECGTCRVISKDKLIKDWHHPSAGRGVQYKQG